MSPTPERPPSKARSSAKSRSTATPDRPFDDRHPDEVLPDQAAVPDDQAPPGESVSPQLMQAEETASGGAQAPTSGKPDLWVAVITPTVMGIILALLAALVVGAAGAAVVLKSPHRYESTAVLTIDQPVEIVKAGSDGIISKLNALRFKYIALLHTSVFSKPVADKLHLPEQKVSSALQANGFAPSLTVLVGARDRDRAVAQEIAQAMAEQLVKYVQDEQTRALIPAFDRIIMTIVVSAPIGHKVEPTKKRAVGVGGVAAAIALVTVYVLVQFVIIRRKA